MNYLGTESNGVRCNSDLLKCPPFLSTDSAPYPPTTGGYQPTPPSPSSQQPYYPSQRQAASVVATPALSAAAATISAEDERKQIQEQEMIKRNSLESAVEDKVRRQVKQVLNAAQVNCGRSHLKHEICPSPSKGKVYCS